MRAAALAGLTVALLMPQATIDAVQAGPLRTKHLKRISPTLPLPVSCLNADDGPPSSDVEPHIAVNPLRERNLIATWWIGQENLRDRAQAGGVAYSVDGGRRWSSRIIPRVDACSGGPADYGDGAHDTWVSFDRDNRAYLLAFSFSPDTSSFWSLTSDTNGRRWSNRESTAVGASHRSRS